MAGEAPRERAPGPPPGVREITVRNSLDGVAEPVWFQLYMIRDRGFMTQLLAEARAARWILPSSAKVTNNSN